MSTPEEVATISGVSAVRDNTRAASWGKLTVVTSRTYTFRANDIFERGMGDDIEYEFVYETPELNVAQRDLHIAYEYSAFLKTLCKSHTRC